jgi:hypothetical protein
MKEIETTLVPSIYLCGFGHSREMLRANPHARESPFVVTRTTSLIYRELNVSVGRMSEL